MKKIVFLLTTGIILFTGCLGGNSSKKTSSDSSENKSEWYSGGTLHKAKISDWKEATEKNKLATCADFMATINDSVPMDKLKERATALKNCIDDSTSGLKNTNNESVSSIAAHCIQTMGY